LVVKETASPHEERIVPIETVSDTSSDVILLACTRDELAAMEPFIQTEYIREEFSDMEDYVPLGYTGIGPSVLWPLAVPDRTEVVAVEHRQIPLGELAIKRGATVKTTDGRAGHVDELIVNPKTEHITHLVMHEGHLWGKRSITIPVSDVEKIRDGVVHVALNKKEVEALPVDPLHRHG
jgi:sporulation protein YlmC with PRC-barrel domain